ncbi:SDR family oxidoreductase [bacterium SCSIO 12696]|nr:SDR family oxidoreductase [bacterium SCSIO 12696]
MANSKVVVITGAARGLGKELVQEFSANGYSVAAIVRTPESQEALSDLMNSNKSITCHVADVSRAEQVEHAFEEILSVHKHVDVLFNSAAVYPKINFLDESSNDWAEALAVNVNGVVNCCKTVLPSMLERNYGRIFNVGSWAHMGPIENSAVYSASKGCVRALTKAISVDILTRGKNVQVHEWIPGHLNTRMSDFTGIDPRESARWAVNMVENHSTQSESSIFDGAELWVPPKSLKRRVLDKLLFWK